MDDSTTTTYGYCHCGCGERTPIAKRTRRYLGHVEGQPTPRRAGHGERESRSISAADYHAEDRGHDSPCWIWQHTIERSGYPVRVMIAGKTRSAHRATWEQKHGPVPAGLVLDHLCRQRDCVNPDHLEPVTPAENTRRGIGSKLTYAAAERIRNDARHWRLIAVDYGISKTLVYRVRKGEAWIPDPTGRRHVRRESQRRSSESATA